MMSEGILADLSFKNFAGAIAATTITTSSG